MTAAERALLLALFRWARKHGTKNVGPRGSHLWKQIGHGFMVGYSPIGFPGDIDVINEDWGRVRVYRVGTVAEAADLLAALNIIPARFSTAYRAGWDAALHSEVILRGTDPAAVPAVPS